MSDATRIVIVGGGYGGVEAAKILNREFRRNREVSITLIDRNPYHTLMTELHEIAGSRTEPEAVQISFKRIFSGSRVNVISDEVQGIDFERKVISSRSATYGYDYLILGTGGHPEFFGTPGIQENSFTLWSLEDAIRIREHVELRFRDAAKEPDAQLRQKQLTFVVAGAGFTGIELAGEMLERADTLCRTYHIHRDEVRIIVIEAKDSILPILTKGPQAKARRYLERKHVEIMLQAPIVRAEPGKVFLGDGSVIETETFIWTCGIQASEFTARINLTKGRVSNDKCSVASPEGIHGMAGCHFDEDERYIVGERGRILVNEYMQSVDYPEVYLCGDMIWYLHQEKVVPQIVETALQSGETAARNVAAQMRQGQRHAFEPKYHGFMVSIGGRYGVAHVMGLSLYGFFAMAMKHIVNLHYLWGLGGVNACWGYLQEEFFQIKARRSIVGGHLAAKVPSYWVLLLRLWLGLSWFFEAVNKIGEGWFRFDEGTKSSWMFSPGVRQAGIPEGVDVTTSASTAEAGAAAPVAASAPAPAAAGWGTPADAAVPSASPTPAAGWGSTPDAAAVPAPDATAAAWGSSATASAPDPVQAAAAVIQANGGVLPAPRGTIWYLADRILPADAPLVRWFKQTFMDGIFAHLMYQVMQVMVVSMEMAIGLALFGGLFTWAAAGVSLGLMVIFTLGGTFAWSQLWQFFAAIVLMGGAGHIAGLDYWVMPWLRDRWNSTRLAQRTHWYVGEPWLFRRRKPGKAA